MWRRSHLGQEKGTSGRTREDPQRPIVEKPKIPAQSQGRSLPGRTCVGYVPGIGGERPGRNSETRDTVSTRLPSLPWPYRHSRTYTPRIQRTLPPRPWVLDDAGVIPGLDEGYGCASVPSAAYSSSRPRLPCGSGTHVGRVRTPGAPLRGKSLTRGPSSDPTRTRRQERRNGCLLTALPSSA